MEHYLEIIRDAVSTLENYLPDAADAAENPSEAKKVKDFCNRLAILVNETRKQI